MKLKYTFETVDMGDEIIMVPIGENTNEVKGVVKVNRAGQEIFSLLIGETTEQTVINSLKEKYENNEEEIKTYVRHIVEILRENDLIIE